VCRARGAGHADGTAGVARGAVRLVRRRRVADSLDAPYEVRAEEPVGSLDGADPAVRRLVADAAESGAVEWAGERRAPERFRATWTWAGERPPEGLTACVRHEGALCEVRVPKTVE
jgi:hypothetical protein